MLFMNAVRYHSKSKNTKKIEVEKDHFYAQMLMVNSKIEASEEFGKKFVER